jgi:hypothetical protein
MLRPIATAPESGELASLHELGSTLDIGPWSGETGNWVGPKGEPRRIVPTHWVTFSDDGADYQEDVRAPNRRRTVLIVSAVVVCIGLTLAALNASQAAEKAARTEAQQANMGVAETEQKKQSEQNESLVRELASAREQLEASQAAEKAARTEAEQAKVTLARTAEQNESLVRELLSAFAKLKVTQAAEKAARTEAKEAKITLARIAAEQKQQSEQNESLVRELASSFASKLKVSQAAEKAARTEAEQAKVTLAAEQKKQSEQTEALGRELASAREQLNATRIRAEQANMTLAERAAPVRAHPSADARPELAAASTSAAAFADPRSEPIPFPAPRAGTDVREQSKVRVTAVAPEVPTRDGAIACQASSGRGGYWAWRMIDGRKCWYEGKPGMSKDNLRWVRSPE